MTRWVATPWIAVCGMILVSGCAGAPDDGDAGTPHYAGGLENAPGADADPAASVGKGQEPGPPPPPTAPPPRPIDREDPPPAGTQGPPPTGTQGPPPTGTQGPPPTGTEPPSATSQFPAGSTSGEVRSVSGRVICESCDGEVLLYAFNTPDQIPRSNNTIKIEILTPPWEFQLPNVPVEFPVYLQARWDPGGKIQRGPPIDGTRVTAYAENPIYAGPEAATGIEIDLEHGPLLNLGPGGPPGS